MDNLRILDEVLRRAKEDPWCRECLAEIAAYEEAFHAIRSGLTRQEQEQLDLYIGACEAWCQAHIFAAYSLGLEEGRPRYGL